MASLTKFINDKQYRRRVLIQLDKAFADVIYQKYYEYVVTVVEPDKSDECNESDEENYSMEAYGNDFEVDQIHRYENVLINIFKELIECDLTKLEKFHFRVIKKDSQVTIKKGMYQSSYLYVIDFAMSVSSDMLESKLVEYTYISHSVGHHYQNEEHVVALDGTLLDVDCEYESSDVDD